MSAISAAIILPLSTQGRYTILHVELSLCLQNAPFIFAFTEKKKHKTQCNFDLTTKQYICIKKLLNELLVFQDVSSYHAGGNEKSWA